MWHRPSRRTLAAFAFAVVAAVMAWLVLGGRERTRRLADGREYSIVAVTYGTKHVIEEGPLWARLIARGSRAMAYRFGFRSSGAYTSAAPSLMVWTRWAAGHSNMPPRYASLADRHGFETEPIVASANERVWPKHDGVNMAWRFENYSRLQKDLELRFYESDPFRSRTWREGALTVRNPAPAAKRRSSAPAAPVKATNGTLEVTLTRLDSGGPPPRRPLTVRGAIAPWVTAEFEFREQGRPTTDWTIKRIDAFGATGNHVVGDRLVVELEEGRRVARFTAAFWKDEPDWSVLVEVTPTRNFPEGTLWTARLPARAFLGEALSTNLPAATHGLIQFRLAVGPASFIPGTGAAPERRVTSLKAYFTPSAPDLHVDIARAVDDTGREGRVTPSLMPRTGICEASVELLDGASFVDLTFAVHRSRKVEFRVRPMFVSTNAPMNAP
jgi:hypothetical protein